MGTHNLKWKSTNEHMLKAKENKWVLRRDLKTDKEGSILSWTGKLFLIRGPTTEKTRSLTNRVNKSYIYLKYESFVAS